MESNSRYNRYAVSDMSVTVCGQCIINNAMWVAMQASFHWFTLSSVQVSSCSFSESFSSSALTTYVSFVTDVCIVISASYINERFEIMKCIAVGVNVSVNVYSV